MMKEEFKLQNIGFKDALAVFSSIILVLIVGAFILKLELQVVLLISMLITISYSMYKGYKWEDLSKAMSSSISRSYEALLIFILIGGLIGSWILSGTIPSLVFYGLNILSPEIFLPAGLTICSITSLATGTSWGTVSTVGIALIGIGESLGLSSALTAGMIVSGAFFGDKISPMSDTTNLASASAGTNIYDHIKSMMYTTIPSYIIALALYTFIGFRNIEGAIDYSQIKLIQDTLSSTFEISIITLIPAVLVLGLSIMRKPAVISMGSGIIAAVVIAIIFQGNSIYDSLMAINNGYTTRTNVEIVDTLIIRGGIQSMMWTFSLAFIALSLGGILDELGYLSIIVHKILQKVKSITSLIFITMISCIFSNAVMGEAYLSIVLNGSLYKKSYKDMGLSESMLSRTLEEGATLTAGLIPWTTAGIFISTALGVDTFSYLPYTFLNIINPIISIIFTSIGIFIIKDKNNIRN